MLSPLIRVRKAAQGQPGVEVFVSRGASEAEFKNIVDDKSTGLVFSNTTSDLYWLRRVLSGRDLCELCFRAQILGYSYATPEDEAKAKEIFLADSIPAENFIFQMKK